MKTRSTAEREITQAVIRFEKEYMGRGPLVAKTFILDDLILVRLKDVMTPAEHRLAECESRERGRYLVKQVRQELLERGRPLLEAIVREALEQNVLSLHTDISTRTGERIIVLTLQQAPQLLNE